MNIKSWSTTRSATSPETMRVADRCVDVLLQEYSISEDIKYATKVIQAEIAAVSGVVGCLDSEFDRAVELCFSTAGSVVVSGVGKSGLIGRKISATLASTGTPSHFLHPTEAMHGDFGSVGPGDVLILLSYSGQTDELVSLAAIARQAELPVISFSANKQCRLAELASVKVTIGEVSEACPHKLAPTASTTAMLALGDALALCVSRRREFTAEDFHKRHPGGGLGKQMLPLMDVARFRVGDNLPVVSDSLSVLKMLQLVDQDPRRVGAVLMVDSSGKMTGIFTDADLRRLISRKGSDALTDAIADHMTCSPAVLSETDLVKDAVQLMLEKRIDEIPVVGTDGHPVGLIDVQDLIALGVMIQD